MRTCILFISCLGVVLAATCTNTEVFDCFKGFIDTDGNGGMNMTEFDAFWISHPCGMYFPKTFGADTLENCDIDQNGEWDANDLTTYRSCLDVIALKGALCNDCAMCNEVLGAK